MPYSESKGQIWADPVNPARVGSDLTLPPTEVQPEIALNLNPAWDYKRFVNLYSSGTNHVVAAISRESATQTYHVTLIVWQVEGFSLSAPVALPQLHYVYDARVVMSGGKTFLVLGGIDFATEHNPPWVRAVELVTTPSYGLTLHPLQYVSTPTPDDAYYRVELALGRQEDHVIVLHDKEVRIAPGVYRQWLFYRAYSLAADGSLAPLCDDTGVPGYSSGSDPAVFPEVELLEVEPQNGLYLLNLSTTGLEAALFAVRFAADYSIALSSGVTVGTRRAKMAFAHLLTPGKVATGVDEGHKVYVVGYSATPSIQLLGTYDAAEDGGQSADWYIDDPDYEYESFWGSTHYPHAHFEDEAPKRYLPLVYYRNNTYTRVGLFEIDPNHTAANGTLQVRRPIQPTDQQAGYWALVALAPNRVLLILRYGGSPSYYLGAIYEWTAEGTGDGRLDLVYRSLSVRHDLSGRFKDVDARAVVGFNEALDPHKQYVLRDVLGQQVLKAWPVNPKIRRNEAEYGFETILGRMNRVRPSKPLLREYEPAVPASVMLQDVLTHFQAEFPWLQWEPLPTFAWYVTGGLIVPEIRAVQVTIEEDPDDRRTLAQIIDELVGAYFPEYAFTVSAENKLLVVPATFLPGYTAPVLSLAAKDIQEGGVFEEPSYTPIYNYQKVVNEAYDFEEDQVVLQPSAFIIKPDHWHNDTTGLPWMPGYAPEPPGTPWSPAQPDVGGSHGLLGLETRALVQEGINPRYTSYVPGGLFSFAVPVQPDTLLDSGTPLEVDIQVEQWLQWRDFLGISTSVNYRPAHTGTLQNLSVSVPGDGTQVQILDASGNWAGVAPANYQGFRVYAAFDAAQLRLNVVIEWTGMTYRFFDIIHGLAVADAAVLIRIDGRGRKWTKSSLEISGSFGTLPQDYTALPGLAESQAEFGLQPGPVLTIRYFRLTPQQCAQIAEAIVRRSYKSRPRYRYDLGPYGHVTPQMLNRAVSTPQSSLMRVTDYEMSVEYLPGEVRSSLIIGAEEVAPAVLFGALLLEDGGYLLFESPLFPVGGPPILSDGRGALLLDEPQ